MSPQKIEKRNRLIESHPRLTMSPRNLPFGLVLGRFLLEDPILLAMQHRECIWADLSCDFSDWKENVAQLCAPALKDVVALHALNDVANPTPSRVASPLFTEPMMSRVGLPLLIEPVARLMESARATRDSPMLTEPVARLMASASATRDSPMLTEPVARLMESARAAHATRDYWTVTVPVAQMMTRAAVCSARTSLLFTEPIPAPGTEVKHAYFATSSTIVPAEPFLPFVEADGIKTIIVRNLPRAIAPEELRERFQLYGVVRDVYLPRNKDLNSPHYGTIRGFALIKYDTAAQSVRAIRILSTLGLSIRGKQVTVEFAKSDTATRS
jgi:hypothetical protein